MHPAVDACLSLFQLGAVHTKLLRRLVAWSGGTYILPHVCGVELLGHGVG